MAEVYVLDGNLKPIAIVDAFTSVIWADRYYEQGDCEIYLPATAAALSVLKKGNYLTRDGSEMVCVIEKIEVDTSAENGNYLIVTGKDVKAFLDRRVVWNTISIDGNVEAAVRSMVDKALGGTAAANRKLLKPNGGRLMYLGTAQGLGEVTTEQISYKNIGEKVREYCRKYKWGYRVYEANEAFYFSLYEGRDLSNSVVFSNDYENLQSSKYVEDGSNIENVALIAGEGEGVDRVRTTAGDGEYSGVSRYELYVDAKDISKSITYDDLVAAYPNGTIVSSGGTYLYRVNPLLVPILDDEQLARLAQKYPSGTVVTIDGVEYYSIPNASIATLESGTPQGGDTVILGDVIYETYLLTRGQQRLSEYGEVRSFEGEIEPNTTFVFREDYDLGDVVTVENEYGISARARIVEVVEVEDDNGYSVQPKFEYEEIAGGLQSTRLLTEAEQPLLTENNRALLRERSASTDEGVKISELIEATSLVDTDVLPCVQGGITKQVKYQNIKGLALNTLYAGAAAQGGAANKAASIPFGKVDSTSTATVFTATVDGITELRNGVCVMLMNGVVTSAAGWTLNVNGLGDKPCYSSMSAASRATTIFNINYTMLFVYNETRVEGGCWDIYYGYDSNTNTIGYVIRSNSISLPASDKFYRYRLLFTSADGTQFVPANTSSSTNATAARTVNQRKINPFGRIVYYNTTTVVNQGANPAATTLNDQNVLSLGYSFNRTGAALVLQVNKPVYIKCAPQSDGSAIIDDTTPYVQALPTTEDGKIYIFIGVAYSETNIELLIHKPVYYYKSGAIRLWTGAN